jgi:hypothetical protein
MFNKVRKNFEKDKKKKDEKLFKAWEEDYKELCIKHGVRMIPIMNFDPKHGLTPSLTLERDESLDIQREAIKKSEKQSEE